MAESSSQFEVRGADGAASFAASTIWLSLDAAEQVVGAATPPEHPIARLEYRNGRFYFIDLDPNNLFLLNGRPAEGNHAEALADGDVLRSAGHQLRLRQAASRLELLIDATESLPTETKKRSGKTVTATDSAGSADALREFWDKRSRDKIARPSPLHPQEAPRPGKARFSWAPTHDLARPWPVALLAWAVIIVTLFSVAAAMLYARAFSPGAVSNSHTRRSLERGEPTTAIANTANANSCTTCHSLTKSMETQCAGCHQTPAFAAAVTGIDAHARARIGCVSCHTEHEGEGFSNVRSALVSCAKCHSNANPNTYAGRRVATPHGGILGYPVVNGAWKWAGLTVAEWAGKADATSPTLKAAAQRQPNESDDDWRRRQFHAVHLNRVRLGNTGLSGDANGMLSCSSCHRSLAPADKITPATTCSKCHNGDGGAIDGQGQFVVAAGAPNCVSCHAPHAKTPDHWNAKLFKPLQ